VASSAINPLHCAHYGTKVLHQTPASTATILVAILIRYEPSPLPYGSCYSSVLFLRDPNPPPKDAIIADAAALVTPTEGRHTNVSQ